MIPRFWVKSQLRNCNTSCFMAAGVFSGLSVPFSFGNRSRDIFTLMFAPMRVVLSVLQSGVSAAISGWFLASFVGLTEER